MAARLDTHLATLAAQIAALEALAEKRPLDAKRARAAAAAAARARAAAAEALEAGERAAPSDLAQVPLRRARVCLRAHEEALARALAGCGERGSAEHAGRRRADPVAPTRRVSVRGRSQSR